MKHYAIISLLTIGLFTGISSFAQSAPSAESIYSNSKYGFSFAYPHNWEMDRDSDIIVKGVIASRSIHFIDKVNKAELLISYTLAKGQEIYKFYADDTAHGKRIKVAGNEAIEMVSNNNRNGKGRLLSKKDQSTEINVEFLDKKKIGAFELKFNAYTGAAQAGEIKKFHALVKSFKFLK